MYNLRIEITGEDLIDIKNHLTQIREQVSSAIKQNPDRPYSPLNGTGVNSGHVVTIEVTKGE